MSTRFDTIHERDRQHDGRTDSTTNVTYSTTDGQCTTNVTDSTTDGQTAQQHRPRLYGVFQKKVALKPFVIFSLWFNLLRETSQICWQFNIARQYADARQKLPRYIIYLPIVADLF